MMKSGCLCLCGCGEETNLNWRTHLPNEYLIGHWLRVKENHVPISEKLKEHYRKLYEGKHFSPETEFKEGEIHNNLGIGGWTGKTNTIKIF